MRRSSRVRLLAALCAGLVAATATTGISRADERDDWEQKQQDAEQRSTALEEQIAGLDESLKDMYRQLDDVRAQLPQARTDLAAAESDLAAAQRQVEQVSDRLEVAQSELGEINHQVAQADQKSDEYAEAVGGLARQVYRSGEQASPMILAMTSQSTADITDRAATAQSLARAQNQALASARSELAVQRNRSARQEALTERVKELHEQAVASQTLAQEKQTKADEKLSALEELESTEAARLKDVEANRDAAKKQLDDARAVADQARSVIARIDEENRQAQNQWNQGGSSNSGGGSGVATSGMWAYPLPSWYPVTSPFGYRYHPIYGQMILHSGVDLGAPCGTTALATANGVVTEVSYNSISGNYVTLNYGMVGGNSYQAMFLHLSAQTVSVGQHVSTGQTVGLVGTTGSSTGCHLHYEFIINGESVDPMNYM